MHSLDCVEIFPIAEKLSSSVDLERLARKISQTSSEHVLLSSDRGVYIPELGRRICSINQLTRQQRASLMDEQCFKIYSFMANYLSTLEASLDHRCQPAEEESSSSDHVTTSPSRVDKESSFGARNTPAGTSRPAELSRGGRTKARTLRGHAQGRRA